MNDRSIQQKVRRTRGSASGGGRKFTTCVNGVWFLSLPEAAERWPPARVTVQLSLTFDCCAGSDDACGTSGAKAATFPAVSTDHLACADLAGERTGKEAMPRAPSEKERLDDESDCDLPVGQSELPADSRGFVALVHARVDLCAAWEQLVRAKDLKISQRALEKLSELGYDQDVSNGEARNFDGPPPARGKV
jgi:hypothetical protein